jgi:glyoxylase-like metal-dependent hydrolase (beta-lactamase superfamily II)
LAAARVHHLNAATLCPASARLMNGPGHGWLQQGRMVCHCLLVETDVGLVLVDTGFGTEDLKDPRGRLGLPAALFLGLKNDPSECALAQVQRLGFRREDVRHLVPTHLDVDHAGGIPDFPDAEVHVLAAEHDAARRPRTFLESHRYRRAHFAHRPRWALHTPGGERWLGFQSVRALPGCDDVLLVPLVGHTRGHCGGAVRTATGWLLHAGDAYFHRQELTARPSCSAVLGVFQAIIATDDEARRRNQGRLRRLKAERPEVTIHCAHDPYEFDQLAVAPRIAMAISK